MLCWHAALEEVLDNPYNARMEAGVLYAALARIVMVVHLAFVVFVVLGGLLALRWPRAALFHVPCAVWGVVVEVAGIVCPLTPLENHLRLRAGLGAYHTDFVIRLIDAVIYPVGLTRGIQVFLGALVVAGNALVYGYVLVRHKKA